MTGTDWNPERYGRFRDLRLRPALDLLAQVPDLPEGDLIDLCCGAGAVGPALAARFAGRALIGLDSSPAMLAEARKTGAYRDMIEGDVTRWQPKAPVALLFSNAALHWVAGHEALLPRLAAMLVPGGMLAVQMPRQSGAPSHRFLRDIAASLFADRFDDVPQSPVHTAVKYWEMMAPLGAVTAWESEYVQRLEPQGEGHPVRAFTQATVMRPYLDRLNTDETAAFLNAYDAALGAAYPLLPDGAALLPFRRVFFTVKV
ncbi:methyltransferase domain-containing protein [Pseudorhodobacter sp. E13]|uniref:methyltransferase domain-containing protein n=1 Tax=Pseudorhodobacter sp. E13 TaxID=2487931 RepID=UPI000F8EE8EA|nr:methyltransferase domain-containing protein [Pseudorhodobacter sp. E13]RUS63155.1 methyltransferase domain-containing protein [Pseudorhodobacter sp. E13]